MRRRLMKCGGWRISDSPTAVQKTRWAITASGFFVGPDIYAPALDECRLCSGDRGQIYLSFKHADQGVQVLEPLFLLAPAINKEQPAVVHLNWRSDNFSGGRTVHSSVSAADGRSIKKYPGLV